MSTRTEKIASLLQHEIAPLLLQHLDESRFGLITVKKITVLADLSLARVYVSVLENSAAFFAEIPKKAWKIARDLAPRLALKKTPRLEFLPEKENKTEKILELLDSL